MNELQYFDEGRVSCVVCLPVKTGVLLPAAALLNACIPVPWLRGKCLGVVFPDPLDDDD